MLLMSSSLGTQKEITNLYEVMSRIQLGEYYVNKKTGFLLESPLEYLPDYFEPWNRLAKAMPELVAKHELRNAIDQMELLDHAKLSGYSQYRLAHLQLGILAAGYVWQEGPEGAAKRLPKCVAIPLWYVSSKLGLEPIICYADLCLANWKYNDIGTHDCMYQLPGGEEARWFFTVAQQVEMVFATGIDTLQNILDALSTNDKVKVKLGLDDLAEVIKRMSSAMMKIHENLSAETFYFVLRPFFEGWGVGSSALSDGLIYEGVCEEPVKIRGITAAQSTYLQLLDALLGISHEPDMQAFLNEMRNFMPPTHKHLVLDIENMPKTLTHMVTETEDKELSTTYKKCIEAITEFRSLHIQIVTKYIVLVSKQKEAKTNFDLVFSTTGTGGSDLIPFLKALRDDTKKNSY